MNLLYRITLILLLIFSLPVLTGFAGLIPGSDLDDNDDFSVVDEFAPSWTRMPVQYFLSGLMLGMSIFVLFVVYLGGRSNHRRFNDRTIDPNNISRGISLSLKTALYRAVFNSLSAVSHPHSIQIQPNSGFIPNLNLIPRRY